MVSSVSTVETIRRARVFVGAENDVKKSFIEYSLSLPIARMNRWFTEGVETNKKPTAAVDDKSTQHEV